MYIVLEVRRNESARLISPLKPCTTMELPQTDEADCVGVIPWGSVAIALSSFLREALLLVEHLGFELFSSLFHIGVTFVVWKEGVPFDLLKWDFIFSIEVLRDVAMG
jgi:hypothetical protein